jgi:hypothetical protein
MRTAILSSLLLSVASCHSGTAGNEHPDASNATADAAKGTADSGGLPDSGDGQHPDAAPKPKHLFVAIFNASIQVYDLPLTSGSTPTVTVPVTNIQGICLDGSSRLYATIAGGSIDAFSLPLTSTSTPAFSFNSTFTATDCKVDAAGDLYASENESQTQGVDVFPAPVSSTSTPSTNLTYTNLNTPYGMGLDANSAVFTAGTTITEFGPYSTGNSFVASFGNVQMNYGLAFASNGDLYVPDGTGFDVYLPAQFSTGATTPDHTITTTDQMTWAAFDGDQNLYSSASNSTFTVRSLEVFAPPYTAAPAVTLTLPDWGSDVAVGP